MTILGLDIGGANIKAADETGRACSRPFAIWRDPGQLQAEIASILELFPETHQVAITMTAELADCFETKSEGVWFILESVGRSVEQWFSRRSSVSDSSERLKGSPIVAWTTDGRFMDSRQAHACPAKVAAANWHALATWCGRFTPIGHGLLIDIGTTTTDIIPLLDGHPIPRGLTDLARLQSGELSYSGVRRTPLCAVAHSVPFREGYCSLAAELFATTLDVYLLKGEIAEAADEVDTANGKAATKAAAYDRIVRMLCCDRDEVSIDEAVQIANFLADVQRQRLAGSLERVVHRFASSCQTIIVAGSGSFLARQIVRENRMTKDAKVVLLAQQLSPAIAEAACAYAVAQLAMKMI